MNPVEQLERMPTPDLIAHLVSRHHQLLSGLPPLGPLVARVASVHGGHDPMLREVKEVFECLRDTLDAHMDLEETVLFRAAGGAIDRELAGARREHAAIREALSMLRVLSDGFEAPAWACASYRRMLEELRALDAGVLEQLQAEDQVLFPRLAAA